MRVRATRTLHIYVYHTIPYTQTWQLSQNHLITALIHYMREYICQYMARRNLWLSQHHMTSHVTQLESLVSNVSDSIFISHHHSSPTTITIYFHFRIFAVSLHYIMHTCGKCQASFSTRKDYSKHQKKCTFGLTDGTTFTLREIGQEITVHLTDGVYICLCSSTGCPNKKGFPTLEGLKKHLRKRKSWVTASNVRIYVCHLFNKISYMI